MALVIRPEQVMRVPMSLQGRPGSILPGEACGTVAYVGRRPALVRHGAAGEQLHERPDGATAKPVGQADDRRPCRGHGHAEDELALLEKRSPQRY